MKTSWLVIIALAVIVIVYGLYSSFQSASAVVTGKAERATIREFVDEEGKTRLPDTYLITAPFDARIEPIALVEGQQVTKGEIVARVVPADLDLAVKEAEAAVGRLDASIRENDNSSVEKILYDQAMNIVASMESTVAASGEAVTAGKAKLDYANKNFRRIRSLRESNAATEESLNQAEVQQVEADVELRQDQLVLSAMRSMQAATILLPSTVQQQIKDKELSHDVLVKERDQAQVRLEERQRDRQRGEMRSPIDGVVLERMENSERRVLAGTELLKIGSVAQLEVEADVLSQDVVDISEGDQVELTGPAVGRTPAHGLVDRIYPAGFTKVSSLGVEQQRVKVIVKLPPEEIERLRTEQHLGVGYRVEVRIFTAEKPQALVISRSALFRGPAGDWQVFAVRGGRARLQTVKVGLLNDQQVEILDGLAEGEQVVLAPETSLVDGDRVRAIGN